MPRVALGCLLLAGVAQAGLGVRAGAAVSGLLASDEDFRPYLGYEVEMLQTVGYPQYGPQLSVTWDAGLLGFLTLRPELGFVQRGYHLNLIRPYNSSYKVRISYLEMPVLFRVGLPRGGVRPGVYVGPFAAYRLDAAGTLVYRGEPDTRILETVRQFDYGLVFGIDSDIAAGIGRLVLDARLNWGLADVMYPARGHIPVLETPGRVQVLSLGLMTGYRF
ncbi:MAG: PorT family protein [candidate division WOR-3 bacterium]|nr:MAG: PorT family protein [candidate division WOR-3 bacterium]